MRFGSWFKVAVVLAVVLVAISALAAEGSVSVKVNKPLDLNGKQIAAGEYKVVWTGKDDGVQVKFMDGRKEVVTAPAKLVESKDPAAYTAVIYKDGKLSGIDIAGKKTALVFSN